MVKKLLVLYFFLLLLFSTLPVQAERIRAEARTVTAVGTASLPTPQGSAITHHRIIWYPVGTVSTCTVKLEKSVDNSAWSDLVAATACTSSGASATTEAITNYVRINVTVLSGGGSVVVAYEGYNSGSGGSSVEVTAFPDNEPFNMAQYGGVAVGSGNPVHVRPTDGTNFMAMLDTAARRGYLQLTDGTDNALVSATGKLEVTCDNCGGSSFADNAAFTFGTTAISNVGFVLDDTAPNAATENSAAAARISLNRMQLVQLGDGAGNERRANVNASNALLTAQTGELPAGTQNIGDVDIVTFPDNEPINNAQWGGAATSLGQKAMTASVPVVIASDQSKVTVAVSQTTTDNDVDVLTLPSVTIGTFPDNEPININQYGGVATTLGQKVMASSVPVVIASDQSKVTTAISQTTTDNDVDVTSLPNEGQQTAANSISVAPDTDNDAIGATGVAPPGEAIVVGGIASGATGGLIQGIPVCDTFVNVTVSTATTTLLVTGVSGRHVRICGINLVTAGANNVALISGTGATCGTGTTGMNGGTTAATGWNFAANGGLTQGGGLGSINQTNATGDSVCVITSAAVQLSGRISYTIY